MTFVPDPRWPFELEIETVKKIRRWVGHWADKPIRFSSRIGYAATDNFGGGLGFLSNSGAAMAQRFTKAATAELLASVYVELRILRGSAAFTEAELADLLELAGSLDDRPVHWRS